MNGPGGQEFFFDASGRPWMAYHAWGAVVGYGDGGKRSLRLDPIERQEVAVVLRGPTTWDQTW